MSPSLFDPDRPFTARYQKPFWLLICPNTARTAVYDIHGRLIADRASDALLSFGIAHSVQIKLWQDERGPTRPCQRAWWMNPESVGSCFLFRLRDLDTPIDVVLATPDS